MATASIILVIRGAHDQAVTRMAFYQVVGLREEGYQVEVVLLSAPSVADIYDFEAEGIPVTRIPERLVAIDFKLLGRLRRHFQHRKPMVVHSHGHKVNFYAAVAACLARVPHTIATVHEAKVMPAPSHYRLPRTWLYRGHEQVVNRLSDHIWVDSGSVKENIVARHGGNPAKMRVVYPSVDRDRGDQAQSPPQTLHEELHLPAEVQIVGNVASLTPRKNHRCLLRAARQVIDQMPDTHFAIAGVGSLQEELQQLAANLQIADQVHFLGFRQDIPQLLKQFDVFVFPSFSEGFGLAVAEAMATGLPVIATRAPGVREVVVEGETGYLVPLDDDQAVAQRVLALLREPQLRQRMGEAGRRRVEENFTRQVMVAKTNELYRNILANDH